MTLGRHDPRESYLLKGSLLNQRAKALNARRAHSTSPLHSQRYGVDVREDRKSITLFTVTQDADTCDRSADGRFLPPCSSRHLFEGTPKFYDHGMGRWEEHGEELGLDASEIKANFRKNDVVPVTWDIVRGMYVPLMAGAALDDITPRHHAYYNAVGGHPVVQANNETRDVRDSRVELYCEIFRPEEDTEWKVIGRVSWVVPWLDTQRAWEDTRSGFATFLAPHHTQIRFRVVGSWHPVAGDSFDKFDIGEFEWMTFGISRVGEHFFEVGEITNEILQLGDTVPSYLTISEVIGSSDEAPWWTHQADRITQHYGEPNITWLTGIHFHATLRSDRSVGQRFESGEIAQWFDSLTCNENLQIDDKCVRQFGWSGGIGNRIDLQSSGNPEVCTDCSNPCGVCTWEWTQDPTSDGFGNPNPDDFWNNTDPCAETGPADCTCDEPTFPGDFYGQIVQTVCSEPSSSSLSSTSSSSISSLSSASSVSSESTITISLSSQSITTSSLSSTSSLP